MSDDMAIDMDNMDDLFGDSTAGLLPEDSPPPKELIERIEELRSGGCHQFVTGTQTLKLRPILIQSRSIAWSRQGCIAAITSNGCLELQSLRIDPKDGSWGLSDPTLVPSVGTSSPGQVPLQHLSWSPNGVDLAMIDTAGRVAIFSTLLMNQPTASRNVMQDSIDELHGVAGSVWLNLMTPNPRNVR